MRILLTGACGTLGRAVRRAAVRGEHEFVLFDTSENIIGDGGVRACITDRQAVHEAAARGCDAIIHTAAMHGSSRGKASNAEFIQTNVIGAEHLFEAALKLGIKRLAIASSMEVLIGRNWMAYGTTVLDESLPPRPDWVYPVTKLQVEALGSMYVRNHGLEVVQLRFAAFDDRPMAKLGMLLLARYITADDAGRAMLLAATQPGLRDEVVHIGPDTPLIQRDVNDAQAEPCAVLERHWPRSTEFLRRREIVPKPCDFWPVTRIDRARHTLGWRPRDTFESFLSTLGWSR